MAMNQGKYIFAQLMEFLPKSQFDYIVNKYKGNKHICTFSCWNQLLVMLFGQLTARESLCDTITSIQATNSLDTNNESIIMKNLQEFFRGKTVVVVAHRLSTVKNADNIVVLNNGDIVESGTHDELVKTHGKYYNLIKNQLELGK